MAIALHAAQTRTTIHDIINEKKLIPETFLPVLENLPNFALILNRNRQIVHANESMISTLGMHSLEESLGRRPGEIMRCIHAEKAAMGCSAAEECNYCGAVEVVINSQLSGKQQQGECRISSKFGDQAVSFDLRVTSNPFHNLGHEFYMVIIEDISHEKRRQSLERTFLHDVTNTSSSILYTASLLKSCKEEKRAKFVNNLLGQCHALADEIQAQRDLLAAETQQLQAHFNVFHPREMIVTEMETLCMRYRTTLFELDPSSHNYPVNSDPRLVRRILINLMKNAAEADPEKEVHVGCHEQDGQMVIWVKNPSVMTESVQKQVFQRSFSTKGEGRGTGTYSIRLLAENYLNASVDFHSDDAYGTTFCLRLPLSIN